MPLSRFLARALIRLYPRTVRRRDGADLTTAFLACVSRERRRLGRAGIFYAWMRLTLDAIVTAVQMRFDARRRRTIASLNSHTKRYKDMPSRLWQDVRFAGRGMRRAPFFSAVVVVTLALAIGATTAVFTVVNAVLLRSLPYREPDRLVLLHQALPKAVAMPLGFSAPDYLAFSERVTTLEPLAVYRNREFELSGVEPPERIMGARTSASLFDTLGVVPAIGRAYTQADDDAAIPVALISDRLWASKFGRDPGVLGRAVLLDRRPYTVVGVMPPQFVFPHRGPLHNNVPADVFIPISFTPRERSGFGSMYNLSAIGRLKPGTAVERADAEARDLVRANAMALYPAELSGLATAIAATATPLRDAMVGRTRTLLLVVFAAVALVLLIACADVASLLLTRAVARQREMAIRAALGAGRRRIIGQLLSEAALLAVAGGLLGLLVAQGLARGLVALAPPTIPQLHDITLDGRILAFSAMATLLTAMLCGLLPALELSRPAAADALKEGGRTGTPGRRQRRIFSALVTIQAAIAVVLLVGGGLLFRSFDRLMAVDPGFRGDRALTLATSLPVAGYRTGADVRSFYTRLMDRVQQLPAVAAVGASTELPLGVRERRAFTLENETVATRELPHGAANEWVIGQYFDALGIPLKRGRLFVPEDDARGERVAIINESFARRFWGDADPVGQRLAWGGPNRRAPWMRIVGVVGDVKQGPLDTETVPQLYTAWLQAGDEMLADNVAGMFRSMRLVVRTEIAPEAMTSSIRQEIRALDPALPITAIQTMAGVVRTSTATPRFNTLLVGAFALLALLLASIGIAGVLATSVSQRTQELGVRLALGARPRSLLLMVLRQGLVLAALGLAAGWPAAWAMSRAMGSLLFEIGPHDPITFAGAAATLAIVALVASAVPAWKATRVDPIVALRRE